MDITIDFYHSYHRHRLHSGLVTAIIIAIFIIITIISFFVKRVEEPLPCLQAHVRKPTPSLWRTRRARFYCLSACPPGLLMMLMIVVVMLMTMIVVVVMTIVTVTIIMFNGHLNVGLHHHLVRFENVRGAKGKDHHCSRFCGPGKKYWQW